MQQIAPRMAPTCQEHPTSDSVLREHVEPHDHSAPSYSTADAMQSGHDSPPDHYASESGMSGSIDPSNDARKGYGKRELSMSKRAAQNRAAQRAFRQRKEGYIKKLEEQVRDYQALTEDHKKLQQDNFALRDYIINLQSRVIELQGEVPPPPSNLDGLHPDKSRSAQLHQSHALLSHQQATAGTLPRLSELGSLPTQAAPPSHELSFYEAATKHAQAPSKDMTPAQAALQGASISRSPTGR